MEKVCPDCRNPLEKLIACGTTDYFCNHCNTLVSKSRLGIKKQAVNESDSPIEEKKANPTEP